MSALGNIGLHSGKYLKSVKNIGISAAYSLRGNVAVNFIKLLSIEMLRKTNSIQTGILCFVKKPVGIFN